MREEKTLFLDIGTEAVKAGISGERALQYYDRFGVFDSRDFERDVIKKAILKAIGSFRSKAKFVILSLPPNVLRARVSLQSLGIGDQKKDIGREILEKNKKEVSENFSRESGILPQELEFSEQLFLEKKIDGYGVPSFKGYQGKEAEARVLSVFYAKEEMKGYRDIFHDLGLKILKIVHPAQQLASVFKKRDGVFLDVGGEITQIFVFKNGNLQEIFNFSMGGRDFSKKLAQDLGLPEEEARVLKERYSRGEITEDTRKKFNDIFTDITHEWHHHLERKLSSFKGQLPSKFFLFGGGSQLPEISESLEEKYSPEILKNPQEFNLILISNA